MIPAAWLVWAGKVNWRLVLAGLVVAFVLLAGWQIRGWKAGDDQLKQQQHTYEQHIKDQKQSQSIGKGLNRSNNAYRPKAREIDRKVQDAPAHNPDNHFDADSVQRISDRIAAGEAARRGIE